jgi:hypothetical protein
MKLIKIVICFLLIFTLLSNSYAKKEHSPLVAGNYALIPGAGQIYNGQTKKGLAIFGIWYALVYVANSLPHDEATFPAICSFAVWGYSGFDAVKTAEKIYRGFEVKKDDLFPKISHTWYLNSLSLKGGFANFLIHDNLKSALDIELEYPFVRLWSIDILVSIGIFYGIQNVSRDVTETVSGIPIIINFYPDIVKLPIKNMTCAASIGLGLSSMKFRRKDINVSSNNIEYSDNSTLLNFKLVYIYDTPGKTEIIGELGYRYFSAPIFRDFLGPFIRIGIKWPTGTSEIKDLIPKE